ncbi:hypothetical protein P5V15_005954 [Pogonomyrmex californicus]
MSHTSFTFLVIIGVLCSMTAAQDCPPNQEWNTCGTACPPTCTSPRLRACTMQCVIGCQCKQGFLLNSSGACVPPSDC